METPKPVTRQCAICKKEIVVGDRTYPRPYGDICRSCNDWEMNTPPKPRPADKT